MDHITILFDTRDEIDNTISLPLYIDDNYKILREKYLEFLENANSKIVKDSNFFKLDINKLLLKMASFNEKSFYRDDNFIFVIKIIALELITSTQSNNSFIICYSDTRLDLIANKILKKIKNIKEFKRNKTIIKRKFEKNFLLKFLYNYIIKLKYFILFKNSKKNLKINSNIVFFSYFINLNINKISNYNFYSQQWGVLSNYFEIKKIPNNWIHIYSPNTQYKNINLLKNDLIKLNEKNKNNHKIIYGYLKFFFFIKILYIFLYNLITIKFSIQKKISNKFKTNNYEIDLSFVYERQFIDSFIGGNFLNNYVWIEIFKNFFSQNNDINFCFYLQENQSWEKALIYYGRNNKNLKLIGYVHHIVRNFDLRYFYKNNKNLPEYLPNFSLVMGSNCYERLINNNPKINNKIVQIEALRYLHLINKKKYTKIKNTKCVLILGGHVKTLNNEIFRSLEKYYNKLDLEFHYKEHPGCSIQIPNSLNKKIIKVEKPIFEILNNYLSVIVAGDSTVGIETFINGANTIIFVDNSQINLSPCMGIKGVKFISSLENLKQNVKLNNIYNLNSINKIFNLDNNLIKLEKFLNELNITK